VGVHRLTARSTGENGTMVEAAPVNVTVFDGSLEVLENGTDGTLTLVIHEGSLTPGRFDLEMSNDLRNWTRVGEFGPGDVAAFYFGIPVESNRKARFYRSVYVP